MVHISVVTIFPELFEQFYSCSLIGKSAKAGLISLETLNPRDFADPPHFKVDDTPYGGGPGMVMKPEPLVRAIRSIKAKVASNKPFVIALSPTGETFNQRIAEELSTKESLVFVCGRYEGIDQRVIDSEVDQVLSVGNYILMGGEVAAMAVIEACVRLIPGVLGNPSSKDSESFSDCSDNGRSLEAPQYTRPQEFEGRSVPEVLISGNHKQIENWRKQQSIYLKLKTGETK